jgi:hypothetical protein
MNFFLSVFNLDNQDVKSMEVWGLMVGSEGAFLQRMEN